MEQLVFIVLLFIVNISLFLILTLEFDSDNRVDILLFEKARAYVGFVYCMINGIK